MLSQGELNIMRETINTLMPDECNILSVTEASDGAGGMIQTWGTAYANVPCRFDYKSGREFVVNAGWQAFTSAMLSVAYDTTISESNRVEKIDIDSGSVTNTYAIVAPINSDQSWRAVKRVQLEKV